MNIVDALNKIKAVFSAVEGQEMPPAQMEAMEYKLADGTVVMIDKIEAGGTVTVDGAPAPDGEHILEDGTKIETAGGVITEVEMPQPLPAPEANPLEEVMNSRFAEMAQWQKKQEELFAAQKAQIEKYESQLKTTSETISGLIKIVEQLAKQPTVDPVAPKPAKFEATKAPNQSRKEWLEAMNESLRKMKAA